ncbi:epoxide hydrolase N-terminal domain-containing protein [Streptomyces sp. NBC_00827]|uniref:epoxide hydrolase N-terminal domain-containing protein n=1 Tax=Streptomyces sp. NBC_00827 TaxID=2903677 RepID=UPI0038647D46
MSTSSGGGTSSILSTDPHPETHRGRGQGIRRRGGVALLSCGRSGGQSGRQSGARKSPSVTAGPGDSIHRHGLFGCRIGSALPNRLHAERSRRSPPPPRPHPPARRTVGRGLGVRSSADYLEELLRYWQHSYDWRTAEARLNESPQFTTEIDGTRGHFAHTRSPEPCAQVRILPGAPCIRCPKTPPSAL